MKKEMKLKSKGNSGTQLSDVNTLLFGTFIPQILNFESNLEIERAYYISLTADNPKSPYFYNYRAAPCPSNLRAPRYGRASSQDSLRLGSMANLKLPHICCCNKFGCGSQSFELEGVIYTGKPRNQQNGAFHDATLQRLRLARGSGMSDQSSTASKVTVPFVSNGADCLSIL